MADGRLYGPRMASTETLNAANLEALGARRLAELLIEVGTGNAVIKRRLRLALAGNAGPAGASRAVSKRLATIARARSRVEWHGIKPLASDLDTQRRAILELVAPVDPVEAQALLWRLVDCASPVLSRCNDQNGVLAAVFDQAIDDIGSLPPAAGSDPARLAGQVLAALGADEHGVCARLVPVLAARLGAAGLQHLRAELLAWQAIPDTPPPQADRKVIGWGAGGPLYADQFETSHRRATVALALRQIADALGDVDGFVAQHDQRARRIPAVAAAIARRLLDAGRVGEAWAAIEAVPSSMRAHDAAEWEHARADVLDALGRQGEAQAFRWQRFLDTLDATHLRAHLSSLSATDNFDAEEAALDHALRFPDIHRALFFLAEWPDLHRTAQLLTDRREELDGDRYALLDPAAAMLASRHPLAATFLHRAMIDFTLENGRTVRHKHAVRHLAECADLAQRVPDYHGAPDHAAYLRALRHRHRRTAAFWQMFDAQCGP